MWTLSEALNLCNSDVDLKTGQLTIRNSKFNKDRLVVMSESLTTVCLNYVKQIHLCSSPLDYFFMKKDKSQIKQNCVYRSFRKILWKCGISHGGRGKGPRVHDFRHTFAVYSLKMQHEKGIDLYCSLPVLSTFLGHSSISATGKYVRLTQEMYPELIHSISLITAYVIPEVRIKNEKSN